MDITAIQARAGRAEHRRLAALRLPRQQPDRAQRDRLRRPPDRHAPLVLPDPAPGRAGRHPARHRAATRSRGARASPSLYRSWRELEALLKTHLSGMKRVAMEYSPGAAIPYVGRVDAGTIEMVEAAAGVEVVSSADLVQMFESRWTPEQKAAARPGRAQHDAGQGRGVRADPRAPGARACRSRRARSRRSSSRASRRTGSSRTIPASWP